MLLQKYQVLNCCPPSSIYLGMVQPLTDSPEPCLLIGLDGTFPKTVEWQLDSAKTIAQQKWGLSVWKFMKGSDNRNSCAAMCSVPEDEASYSYRHLSGEPPYDRRWGTSLIPSQK